MIDTRKELRHKALSHRGRGTGNPENTFSAITQVANSGFKYLEIDARFSKDNIPYVFHDTVFKNGKEKIFISKSISAEIDELKYKTGDRIPRLEEILEWWSDKKPECILCLDIKESGFEKLILDLIEKYNLNDSINIYTWVPQTIVNFHKELNVRGYSVPIFFSHLNTEAILTKTLSKVFNLMRKRFIFKRLLFSSDINWRRDLKKYNHGYHHIATLQELPEEIISILKYHQGGICVPLHVDTHHYKYAKDLGLKVAIFGLVFGQVKSITSSIQYNFLAGKQDVDIVFCDALLKEE